MQYREAAIGRKNQGDVSSTLLNAGDCCSIAVTSALVLDLVTAAGASGNDDIVAKDAQYFVKDNYDDDDGENVLLEATVAAIDVAHGHRTSVDNEINESAIVTDMVIKICH